MIKLYNDNKFCNMSLSDFLNFIDINKDKLIGSAVFTKNNSITSKIVSLFESVKCKDKSFVPSHTGSIVEYENNLYVFNMKPLKANKTLLKDYVRTTNDDFIIVLKDFKLDNYMFSQNILEHEGEFYPYFSAARSVFSKRNSKWRRHCSELHLRELQKQGIMSNINPEITPDELFHIMTNEGPANDQIFK